MVLMNKSKILLQWEESQQKLKNRLELGAVLWVEVNIPLPKSMSKMNQEADSEGQERKRSTITIAMGRCHPKVMNLDSRLKNTCHRFHNLRWHKTIFSQYLINSSLFVHQRLHCSHRFAISQQNTTFQNRIHILIAFQPKFWKAIQANKKKSLQTY